MEKRSKFLKNLLTTASAVTVLMGGMQAAYGAAIANLKTEDGTDPATLANGAGSANITDSAAAPANFANGDSFYFTTPNNLITAGNVTIASIDLNAQNLVGAGADFKVKHNVNLGSVVDFGGAGVIVNNGTQQILNVIVEDGNTLTLTGIAGVTVPAGGGGGTATPANTYSSLGDITLGNAGVGGAALTINLTGGGKTITLNGEIDGDAANKGTLSIAAGNTVTFNGKIGKTKGLLATNVTGTAIFNDTVKSKGITVAAGGDATFNKAVTVGAIGAVINGTAKFTGAVDSTAADITLNAANSVATFNGAVDVTGHVIKFATAVSVDATKGVIVDGPAASVTSGGVGGADVIDFNNLAGFVTIKNGGQVTGRIVSSTNANGNLVFGDGGGKVTGNVGNGGGVAALTNVNFSNTTNGESLIDGTVNATNINITTANANARVTGVINGAVVYTAAGTLTAGDNVNGTVAFGANDGTLVVADNKTIVGAVTGNGALAGGGNGTITFQGRGVAQQTIGAGPAAVKNIIFAGTTAAGKVEFQNTVNAANLLINNAGAKVETAAAVTATNIIFNQAGQFTAKGAVASAIQFKANGTFIAENGQNITGAISTTVPNAGILDLQGASNVTGAIGANGLSLREIKLDSGGTNGNIALGNNAANAVFAQKITVGGTGITTVAGALNVGTAASNNGLVYGAAGTVNINGGMTGDVNFGGNANAILNLANGQNLTGNIVAGGANRGQLDIKGTSNITGTIGADGASILKIDTAAGNVNFQKQVYAQTVNVGNAGTNITAAELITGNVVYANAGTVVANGGLKGNVDFANNAGSFTLGDGQLLDGLVDSTAGINGTLNFAGGGVVTGTVGNANNALTAVNFNGAGVVVLSGVTEATTMTFGAAGVEVDVKGNITATDIKFQGKESTIVVDGGKNITADIDGDSTNVVAAGTLTFNGASVVTGVVGKTKGLTAINFKNSNAATKTVSFSDIVKAATVTFDESSVGGTKMTVDGGAGKDLTGNVVFKGASDIAHVVELSDGANLNGSVDNKGTASVGTVTFKGTSTVTEKIGETKEIKLLDFNGAGGKTVTLDKDVRALTLRYTDAGAVDAKGDVTGNIDFTNKNGTFTIADGKNITGKVSAVNVGTLKFKGTTTLTGDVGTAGSRVALLDFNFAVVNKTVTLDGIINATDLKFNTNAGTVIAQKDVSGNLDFNNFDGIFALPTNGTFTGGAVDGSGNNKGTLRVDGNTTFKGKIGDGNPIDKVLYTGAYTLTVDSNAAAGLIKANNGVDFDSKDATLKITGNFDQSIESAIVNATGATIVLDGIGANKDVTFKQTIGTAGAVLKTFKVGAGVASNNGNAITLQEDSYIASAEFAGLANLKLDKNGGQFKIGSVQLVDNVVSLQINKDATLVAGTNLTAANGSKLKELNFLGNYNLTVSDGVDIAANAVTNGVNSGTLTFLGSSTFDAKVTNNLVAVDAKAVIIGKKLTFVSDVNATNITGGAGTLAFTANVTGAVDAGVAGQGTVQFVNTAPLTVAGTFGANAASAAIQFSGSDVTFTNNVNQAGNSFIFDSKNPTTVTLNNTTDFSNVAVTNSSAAGTKHVIVLTQAGDLAFNSVIASAANPIEVRLNTAATKAQIAVDTKGAIITTLTKGTNEVEFTVDGSAVYGIGTNTTNLSKVTFSANGSTGDTFADTVDVIGTKTATFRGILASNDLRLLAAGSTATFTDGAVLNSKVSSITGGEGVANFTGSGTVNQEIGTVGAKLKSVSFSSVNANAVVNLGANVSAGTITSDANTTLQLNKNLSLNGTTSFSSLALGSNTLTANNPAGVSLTLTKTVQLTTTISGNGNAVTGGMIKNTPNSKADVTGLAAANITVDDLGLDVPEVSRTFTLLQNDGTYAAPTAFAGATVTGKAALTRWTGAFNPNGSFILTQRNEAVQVLSNDLGNNANAEDKINAEILAKSGPNVQELNKITNAAARKEYIERVVATNAEPAITDLTSTVVSDLGDHVFNLAGLQGNPPQERLVSASDSGVAAGDDPSRYGVWATPFYNKGRQKSRNNAAGYESATFGGMFGFDTKVNDNSIFGAAIALLNTDIKFKNFKSGDKTKADTVMFSVYGMQQFTNNIFAQAVVTFGSNRIDTDEKRITGNTTFQKAKGKYNSAAFGFEALGGYNYLADQMVSITPMAGLKYTRVNDDSYKETGTTTQNLSVHKKASNRLDLVGGVRVAGGTFDVVELAVTPEIHGFVNFDVLNKKQKVTLRLDGTNTPLAPKSGKQNRVRFNTGVGLNASYSYMEYGLGYDAYIANKYLAHQGTLKVRVNF